MAHCVYCGPYLVMWIDFGIPRTSTAALFTTSISQKRLRIPLRLQKFLWDRSCHTGHDIYACRAHIAIADPLRS